MLAGEHCLTALHSVKSMHAVPWLRLVWAGGDCKTLHQPRCCYTLNSACFQADVRMQRGPLLVMMDTGSCPPLPLPLSICLCWLVSTAGLRSTVCGLCTLIQGLI